MTRDDVAKMIASFGFERWRYSHFSKVPAPPYVVYYYPNENDVYADNSNYVNRCALFVELFTEGKDLQSEGMVEAGLKGQGLTWYKQTDFLNDEKLFQTTYETEVLIDG